MDICTNLYANPFKSDQSGGPAGWHPHVASLLTESQLVICLKVWLTGKKSSGRLILSHHPEINPMFVHCHADVATEADLASSHVQKTERRQLWPLVVTHYALLLPTPCTSYSASAYHMLFKSAPLLIRFLFYLHGSHVCCSGMSLQLGISN